MLIAINTSALNVGSVSEAIRIWRYTGEFIPERNHFSVIFAANDSQRLNILLTTAEFTVGRNRINVTCVIRRSVSIRL